MTTPWSIITAHLTTLLLWLLFASPLFPLPDSLFLNPTRPPLVHGQSHRARRVFSRLSSCLVYTCTCTRVYIHIIRECACANRRSMRRAKEQNGTIALESRDPWTIRGGKNRGEFRPVDSPFLLLNFFPSHCRSIDPGREERANGRETFTIGPARSGIAHCQRRPVPEEEDPRRSRDEVSQNWYSTTAMPPSSSSSSSIILTIRNYATSYCHRSMIQQRATREADIVPSSTFRF